MMNMLPKNSPYLLQHKEYKLIQQVISPLD